MAGQIGLEKTPDAYVAAMVEVFREVRRVLRDDGTLWLNLGDSYSNIGKWGGSSSGKHARPLHEGHQTSSQAHGGAIAGLKPKELVGIPWRVAFALQADGWYLRSDIIWAKPNPMPESVTDRPTKSHEYVFLLAKSERYFFDAEAVREERVSNHDAGSFRGACYVNGEIDNGTMGCRKENGDKRADLSAGRNIRSVWTITPEPYPGAHFATYPRKLVEPCVKAGSSERGCCPACGAPWERVVERTTVREIAVGMSGDRPKLRARQDMGLASNRTGLSASNSHNASTPQSPIIQTLGWRPTCSHDDPPIPCRVLDPFAGSGTTLQVADALGRHGIGLDLSREYLDLARRRLERPHAPIARPGKAEPMPLFDGAEQSA